MRTAMRGWLTVAGASAAFLLVSACATNRSALRPLTEADLRSEGYAPAAPPAPPAPAYARAPSAYGSTSSPLARPAPLPSGPLSARELAQRTGLAYQDGGSYVLLSNASTRIRLYPDTRLLAIDGSEIEIRGRIVRQGPSVIVPGPAVALVESHLHRAREQQRIALASQQGMTTPAVAGARVPPRTASRPAARVSAPSRALHSSPGGDASWNPAGVPERPWRWIVIHHSDDLSGNAAKYNAQHLAQGWENGLGYHFVIGNGTQSGDGEVEVGGRWLRQIQGAHAKTDDNCFNEQGIGVCLVGDFENHGRPSAFQMAALTRLCLWLMDRYDIPLDCVKGHMDCKPTACPGKNFPWQELRSRLAAGR